MHLPLPLIGGVFLLEVEIDNEVAFHDSRLAC